MSRWPFFTNRPQPRAIESPQRYPVKLLNGKQTIQPQQPMTVRPVANAIANSRTNWLGKGFGNFGLDWRYGARYDFPADSGLFDSKFLNILDTNYFRRPVVFEYTAFPRFNVSLSGWGNISVSGSATATYSWRFRIELLDADDNILLTIRQLFSATGTRDFSVFNGAESASTQIDELEYTGDKRLSNGWEKIRWSIIDFSVTHTHSADPNFSYIFQPELRIYAPVRQEGLYGVKRIVAQT